MNLGGLELARAERIRDTIEKLILVNEYLPVIVEGRNDKRALRALGVRGTIITLHRGQPLYEFCQSLEERYDSVVLLTDWDVAGEALYQRLGGELCGMHEEFARLREALKALCQKDVKDIEGIPKLLKRLEGDEVDRGQRRRDSCEVS